jgi:hypothetical protein
MMLLVYVNVPVILTGPWGAAETGFETEVGGGAEVGAATVGLSGGLEVGASERLAPGAVRLWQASIGSALNRTKPMRGMSSLRMTVILQRATRAGA